MVFQQQPRYDKYKKESLSAELGSTLSTEMKSKQKQQQQCRRPTRTTTTATTSITVGGPPVATTIRQIITIQCIVRCFLQRAIYKQQKTSIVTLQRFVRCFMQKIHNMRIRQRRELERLQQKIDEEEKKTEELNNHVDSTVATKRAALARMQQRLESEENKIQQLCASTMASSFSLVAIKDLLIVPARGTKKKATVTTTTTTTRPTTVATSSSPTTAMMMMMNNHHHLSNSPSMPSISEGSKYSCISQMTEDDSYFYFYNEHIAMIHQLRNELVEHNQRNVQLEADRSQLMKIHQLLMETSTMAGTTLPKFLDQIQYFHRENYDLWEENEALREEITKIRSIVEGEK